MQRPKPRWHPSLASSGLESAQELAQELNIYKMWARSLEETQTLLKQQVSLLEEDNKYLRDRLQMAEAEQYGARRRQEWEPVETRTPMVPAPLIPPPVTRDPVATTPMAAMEWRLVAVDRAAAGEFGPQSRFP